MERDLTSYSPAVKNPHNPNPDLLVLGSKPHIVTWRWSGFSQKNHPKWDELFRAAKPQIFKEVGVKLWSICGAAEPLTCRSKAGIPCSKPRWDMQSQNLQEQHSGNVPGALSFPQLPLQQPVHCGEMKPASIFLPLLWSKGLYSKPSNLICQGIPWFWM